MSLRSGVWLSGLLVPVLLAGCGLTSEEELFGVFDDTPPEVVATLPGADWIKVPPSITVRVWFSEVVDPASVWIGSIQLISGQDLASAVYQVEAEADGRGLVLLDPREPLIPGVEYMLRITEKVTDLYGNPLQDETRVVFETLR